MPDSGGFMLSVHDGSFCVAGCRIHEGICQFFHRVPGVTTMIFSASAVSAAVYPRFHRPLGLIQPLAVDDDFLAHDFQLFPCDFVEAVVIGSEQGGLLRLHDEHQSFDVAVGDFIGIDLEPDRRSAVRFL